VMNQQPGSTTDDFDHLDADVWLVSSHALGRGPLRPELAVAGDGVLRLGTRRAGFPGSEVRTRTTWLYGSFTARARCTAPAGTLCTLFLYQTDVGDRADEIDIELLSGTREVWFTTWLAGRRVDHAMRVLPFDPSAGFHTYTIERTPNEIRFSVNGTVLHRFSHRSRNKLPQAAMPLFMNTWWPAWLEPVGEDGTWEIDSVEIR
jgi:endo-1,3-1,4-beta-glycanase ExoK